MPQPLEQLDFGMIRAMISARQAASPTARALSVIAASDADAAAAHGPSLADVMLLLAGHADTAATPAAAFLPHSHFAADILVSAQGETHA